MDKKILINIIMTENGLSKKKQIISHGVMKQFVKISSGRDKDMKKWAIDAYNTAKRTNIKLTFFLYGTCTPCAGTPSRF